MQKQALWVSSKQIQYLLQGEIIGGTYLIVHTEQHGDYDTPLHPAPTSERVQARRGIYIASKTKHAARWRALRAAGVPINSTWIDEAGVGESQDLNDLWRRCLAEASGAAALVIYREPDDVLKGGWVELGAAASHGVPVFAVGLREFTISKHESIRHFDTFDEALDAALKATP